MKFSIIANKCGMSRHFTPDGLSIPVTIVKIHANYIIGTRLLDCDNYLVKIAAVPAKRILKKPLNDFYKKLGMTSCKHMLEFKVKKQDIDKYEIGKLLDFSLFNLHDKISVLGMSKGKGFSGVIKRHNFSKQPASHGNSLSHRAPGSIGQCQTPGKVYKGKKMAGRMGNENVTVLNLEIINIYKELNALAIKGSIPGPNGSKILLKKSSF